MDYRDIYVKFEIHSPKIPTTLIKRFKDTISEVRGRKYSSVSANSETDTKISLINNKVKTYVINQRESINLKSRKYLPLKVENRTQGGVQVTYVKVKDLVRNFGLNKQAVTYLTELAQNQPTNLEYVSNRVQSVTETSINQLSLGIHAVNTLKEKLNEPINSELREQIDSFLTKVPSTPISEIEKLPVVSSDEYISQRVSGSNSISSSVNTPMLTNWKKADEFVKELAYKKEPLTLDALCQINKILLENIPPDEEESSPPGTIRENPVQVGGFRAPTYVFPLFVGEMVNETLSWINEGIKKCEEGKENPIVLSALVFQRLVSIHPFTDGNGRTCRLAMDYTLRRLNLPPALLGKDVNVAAFGDQPGQKATIDELGRTPSQAIAVVFEGVKKSYSMIES